MKKVLKYFGSAKKVINFAAPKIIKREEYKGEGNGEFMVYDGNRVL